MNAAQRYNQYRKLERKRKVRRFVKRWTSKPLDRVSAIMLATVFTLSVTALIAVGYGIILALLKVSIYIYSP